MSIGRDVRAECNPAFTKWFLSNNPDGDDESQGPTTSPLLNVDEFILRAVGHTSEAEFAASLGLVDEDLHSQSVQDKEALVAKFFPDPKRLPRAKPLCSMAGCSKQTRRYHSLCQSCYYRLRAAKLSDLSCLTPNCPRTVVARGYCRRCAQQNREGLRSLQPKPKKNPLKRRANAKPPSNSSSDGAWKH